MSLENKNILLSIIIPVYNAEAYLTDCLNSVIDLTACNNYEVICVNDCSTDNSLAILNSFAKKYQFIKVISNAKNSGVSYTRNVGINLAQGKYITFIDSDDILNIKIKELFIELEQDDYDLYVFGHKKFVNDLEVTKEVKFKSTLIKDKTNFSCMLKQYLNTDGIYWYPWGKVYKKDILINNKILFDTNLICSEDFKFVYSYLPYAKSILISSKLLINYRLDNNKSITKLVDYKHLAADFKAYIDIFTSYKAMNVDNELLSYFINIYLNRMVYVHYLPKEEFNKIKESYYSFLKQNFSYIKGSKNKIKQIILTIFGLKLGSKLIGFLTNV